MTIKKHIPNFLTICNLLCGALGISFIYSHNIFLAVAMIWIGAVFDFLDGFTARMLKTSSPIGKELDSLADVITFSLLPSFVIFRMLGDAEVHDLLPYASFAIVAFSALRLAKFNVDERQSTKFFGLPTPASALVVSSLPYFTRSELFDFMIGPVSLVIIIVLLSFLMVSEIQLFSLKFKGVSWRQDKWKINFIILSIVFFSIYQILSIPLIIVIYIIFSLLDNESSKKHLS